jgi:UDP-N-acetylmuramyl pentapeptide phosphotransferase/UDP-N-acetylglucosamine-1-phosphate transferase
LLCKLAGLDIIISFLSALVIVILAIPSIINVADLKSLYDVPDERKSHNSSVPTLGGIALYAGIFISTSLINDFSSVRELQYLFGAASILFFMGVKDDILILSASKKLLGQLLAAAIVVILGGFQLTSFYGFFGIFEIPEYLGIIISIFTVVVITNSLNLIDGINCLSGSIGVITAGTFGTWFYFYGMQHYAMLSASVIGALLGFLWFNKTPAKIFMGDTGSLILGIVISCLAIKFIESNKIVDSATQITSAAAVAIGILAVPLFDTLRVFSLRIAEKKSPFKPDKRHIHHRLLDLGLNHIESTIVLVIVNIMFIVIAFAFHKLGNMMLTVILLGLAMALSYLPVYIIKRRKDTLKVNSNE